MKENIVQTKSYAFAIKIVNICKVLQDEKKEFILSKQLLRSGTSVGANIEEAIGGQSRKDFYAKLTISYKEARETKYWIRLLTDTHYLTTAQSEPLLNDIEELLRIIGSIQKTIRNKN
ncbi:four helix bundle protein [Algibacter amylolyticus]|uniref:Four helix bundle protein n=1 Tax=Algibacter amylolyticus TaxID=1608400 RepID=A0A5M7BD37_9FLAO|nr:four helix bundle protein [Algibacter amylolyticus]KAA5826258.1 four helix bundle protein [Algibacter amylolyticus]MBB5268461.1 four helix bundle protein [Algibacter amylolyticus]TSJ80296.1 four helix bundle protein [Algibacter amylolyticus]